MEKPTWSNNKDRRKNKTSLNRKLLHIPKHREDSDRLMFPLHKQVHDKVLALRDSVFAHSDSEMWNVEFPRHQVGYDRSIQMKDPFEYLTLEEADKLVENTSALRSQIDKSKSDAIKGTRAE